ncbi:MAG: peptide-methionine (S)-S-oxide reductase MsrA [Armatimonadetes bacterium]|nr:peptide-methionine (S)-S-oxide reductase MsrA [Armatimonadota bacterium]
MGKPLLFLVPVVLLASCAQQGAQMPDSIASLDGGPTPDGLQVATFANGCFWCTEAIFQRLEGVAKVVSGYSGGHIENPTYEQVSSKTSGHAEVCQITYDPETISFKELLEVFWKTHDPTTKDRQGPDVGPQYRSVIFYHDDRQKELAETYRKTLDESGAFNKPIVTEIQPFSKFYKAEEYHQNYFNLNKNRNPYCTVVIVPKLEKFEKVFKDKLKKDTSKA